MDEIDRKLIGNVFLKIKIRSLKIILQPYKT